MGYYSRGGRETEGVCTCVLTKKYHSYYVLLNNYAIVVGLILKLNRSNVFLLDFHVVDRFTIPCSFRRMDITRYIPI